MPSYLHVTRVPRTMLAVVGSHLCREQASLWSAEAGSTQKSAYKTCVASVETCSTNGQRREAFLTPALHWIEPMGASRAAAAQGAVQRSQLDTRRGIGSISASTHDQVVVASPDLNLIQSQPAHSSQSVPSPCRDQTRTAQPILQSPLQSCLKATLHHNVPAPTTVMDA